MEQNLATTPFNLVSSSTIYFSVKLSDLTVDNQPVEGFAAVYRPDIQKTLAIHRHGYNLVKNEDIYPNFESALHQSPINTKNMISFFELCTDGAKTVGHYIFPEHCFEPIPGEKIYLHIKLVSTYDGSLPLSSTASGWRAETNTGIVLTNSIIHKYGKKSNRQINPETVIKNVTTDLNLFNQEAQLWEYWAHLPVTDEDVHDIGFLLCLVKKKRSVDTKYTNRAKFKLIELYHIERKKLGRTAWALVNALNLWVYCNQFRKDALNNKATTILGRESKVIDILKHDKILDLGQS